VPRVVGISGIGQGSVVAERYRVVERINRFAVADRSLAGVEYEYWLAFDEARAVEVWLQIGALGEVAASGSQFAGAVAALRRLNHPAIPAILDFGEIEVEVAIEAEADAASGPADGVVADAVVADVGYAVLEPVEGESLAALLMRGALTEAEVFAALTEVADALKLLHEVELVHGHLSAYSVLLTERGVVLIDVVASLALENASGAVLTPAADIYALAWLVCVALAGVETVEAEFGVGFDTGSSPEDEYASGVLTAELVERRRAWAQRNLVAVFGIEAGLAELLVAALGESGGRPTAAAVAGALRVRGVVGEEAVGAGVAAVGAAVVVEEVAAEEAAVAEEVAVAEEEVIEAEVAGAAGAVISGGAESASAVQAQTAGAAGGAAIATLAVGAELGVGAYPETKPPSGPARHRRPKSALYVAVGIVVLIAVAVIWGLSARKPTNSASPATSVGPSSAAASPGTSAGASSAPAVVASPSSSAAASTAASPSASAVASSGSSTSPGVLATAPSSPSQALQQVQQAVSQAQAAGQIPSQAQGPLNQAIGTLQQEISSGSSVQQGVTQLRQALNSPGLSQTLVSQINSLIQYLAGSSGS
jgi:tRNA A-37 threonylcarbamoyl transferase component Bud32